MPVPTPSLLAAFAFLSLATCCAAGGAAVGQPGPTITLETDFLRYSLGADGSVVAFVEKATGKDHRAPEPRQPFALVRKQGKTHPASACSFADGLLTVAFGESGATATLKVTAKKHYLVLEVTSVSDGIEELVFGALRVALAKHTSPISGVAADDAFAACVRALNLQVNLGLGGGPTPTFLPTCYAKYGLVGARLALVGCPTDRLRPVLQEVVREEGLPYSPLGGPFALDAEENRGSYVFADVSEKNVDEWIALARKAGLAQIHLCGWQHSYGHNEPRKDLFPNGLDDLKAVVAKIHAARLRAGMHILISSISPHDPFATPVPDKRLAKDATFTLAAPVGEADKTIPTTEAPGNLDTMWAYASHGNVVQIGDELIQYSGLAQAAPFGFTGCTRGAFGTRRQPHENGAAVHHLYVRYTAFHPDETSTLVDEVAECIARVFNACRFDMIYMDGSEGMIGGWHGVSKMRAAVFRRLKGRVLVEASEWGYHSWPFHSRIGAYDHPKWALKRFVDIHCNDTDGYRASSLLAAQLGWWALLGPTVDHEAEFRDEIEYLCAKALALDAPMSFQTVTLGKTPPNARQDEFLELIGRYERLRLARAVPEPIRARLRPPKEEFRLAEGADGQWQFLPTDYAAHKVTGLADGSQAWTVRNRFAAQPLKLRIQALYAAAPYDSPDAVGLVGFGGSDEAAVSGAAQGVRARWEPLAITMEEYPEGRRATYSAESTLATPKGAWARLSVAFHRPVSLGKLGALGVWIEGDGKGELLNFQLTNPSQFWGTWDEHYVDVSFTGWRYFELHLRERDAERFGDYTWPYGGIYDVYRSPLIRDHVSALNIYYNNLPPKAAVRCVLRPIKALPVVKVVLANPALTVGGSKLIFPVILESGQYIELESPTDCALYDERGALRRKLAPQGDLPRLAAGDNRIAFTCGQPADAPARAHVTVITQGEPLRGAAP